MRKAGIILLVIAITAGAVFGFMQTGFFQKAIWVFQGTAFTGPAGSQDGHGFQGGRPDGQRPRGDRPEGHGPNGGSAVSLAKTGWFALIMAFFAMVSCLLDGGVRRAAARRRH
jgi:hypothetical protein